MLFLPVILVSLGAGILVTLALSSVERDVPVHEPDLPPTAPAPTGFPKTTGYRLVDRILNLLKQAADRSGYPLGLLVGWIAKECGGKIDETTRYGEVGYAQMMPDEYKRLGLDPEQLASDPNYSINGLILLIKEYAADVDVFGIRAGTEYYWRMVKLVHCMGLGAVKKIYAAAKQANAVDTWARLEGYVEEHESELLHLTKHSPTKWFHFVDKVVQVGRPFGFGQSEVMVGGGAVFADAADSDPITVLGRI